MIIGVQGGKGSANQRACTEFCKKRNIKSYKIKYLISTERVLKAIKDNKIDLGIFAVKSQSGLVKETQDAIKKFLYEKIDEITLKMDHVLLGREKLKKKDYKKIISHPQAIREHKKYLRKSYPNAKFIEAEDTALAAKKLGEEKYNKKTLIIAPKACAKIYHLRIIEGKLPTNKGYITTFYLAKKSSREGVKYQNTY